MYFFVLSHGRSSPASENKCRYLSLYKEDLNINLRLESEDFKLLVKDVYYFFEDQELIT